MYYDPGATNVKEIINRRGVSVSCSDSVLNDPACFANHAVSILVEASMLPCASEPLEYIGDYYLHKTERTLEKQAWMAVSENVGSLIPSFQLLTHTLLLTDQAKNC